MMRWLLLPALFLVWLTWLFAAVLERAMSNRRRNVLSSTRCGISAFPAIPLFPVAGFALCVLLDEFAVGWGSALVAGAHGVLEVVLLGSVFRSVVQLRSTAPPDAA